MPDCGLIADFCCWQLGCSAVALAGSALMSESPCITSTCAAGSFVDLLDKDRSDWGKKMTNVHRKGHLIHLKFFLYIDGYLVEIHMGYKYFHTSCQYREVYPYVSLPDLLNTFPVVLILVLFRHPLTKWLATTNESKFPKSGFNSTRTMNFQMFKLDLEKAEEPENKFPISVGSLKRQESSRKTTISALLTMLKTDCMNHNKLWKILQEMGIPDHLTCLLRNL